MSMQAIKRWVQQNPDRMDWLLRHAVLPLIRHLRPDAIMIQCGADAIEEDPLSRLALTNASHRAVVAAEHHQPLPPDLQPLDLAAAELADEPQDGG